MTSKADKVEDIGEYHPYADMLLEDFYKEKVAELQRQLADKDDVIADRDATIAYNDETLWRWKQTVTTVTDARAQVIIEIMMKTEGSVVDSHQFGAIIEKHPNEKIRLPAGKDNSRQIINAMKRVPKLNSCIQIKQSGHSKKVWRLIRME